MLLAVFLSVAFLIAVIILVTRHMTGSIKNIVAAMKKAGAGDLTVRVRRDRKMPSEMETITDQFNRMMGQMNKLVEEVKMVSARQKDAEITALEAQINPHFLYNTLDTINWMAINADQYEISSAIGALARILRYGIDKSNSIVTLREEMEWLQQYIFLQQTRLKNTFSYELDVPKELLDCKIHKLLFQPFVENAILHGFEGVRRHHILVVKVQKRQNGFLQIIVKDNGKGIQENKIQEIKSRLLDSGEKDHIGMNNAIERLRMYYGEEARFDIKSQVGEGTVRNSRKVEREESMRIVVVEDEMCIREGLVKLLERIDRSYIVVGQADNGKSGLELIKESKPDLVITDVQMPIMDGLEMLRCLQEKQPLPKVIILSAYSEFSYAQQAIKLGVSEYLIKPIIINELTQSLRSIEQQLAEESNKKGEAPELRSLEEVFSGIQSGRLPFTEKIRNYVYQKFSVDLNGNFVLILAYLGGHYEEERKRMVPSLLSLLRKWTIRPSEAVCLCFPVWKRNRF